MIECGHCDQDAMTCDCLDCTHCGLDEQTECDCDTL